MGGPNGVTGEVLNDVQRNQVFSMGMLPAEVGFGGLGGSTNIIMRASKYQGGGRVSYAARQQNLYRQVYGHIQLRGNSAGWSYSLSFSSRFAQEAYIEGTYMMPMPFSYLWKKIDSRHSLNFTGFYTPNIRGRSSSNTQEVIDLRGRQYNSFWGYQNGKCVIPELGK
jgi:hypothetical protein